jgi:2-dehydro-3-deoxyphosphogluconate aldolase/(4S)-4-hydroxy-2-oxoglutarate aldolase
MVVETLAKRYGDQLLLGMGTLTRPVHAAEAKAAGARFIVSPHCEAELASAMAATGLAVMIGAFTPTEIVQARRLGADVVKIFPGSLGGPAYLRSLRGPFPEIPIMPTGGVSVENVSEWLAAGAFALGAGSELCPPALAREGRFDDIAERARAFVRKVRESRESR